jgi:phage terminase small subunit
MSTDRMPHRRRLFVIEYLKDHNAKQAYIRAGYAARGHAAAVNASRLLIRADVAAEVARLQAVVLDDVQRSTGLTLERLTLEVARGAFFDIRRLKHEDGTPKDLHELDEDTASAIAGVELEEVFEGRGEDRKHTGRIHKYKLVDRRAYVDMGLKVIGGYKDDNKQRNPGEALAEMLRGMKSSAIPVVPEVGDDAA